MKRILILHATVAAVAWTLAGAVASTYAQEAPPAVEAPPPGGADTEGAEVLTRGPIHEAYAEPVTDPKPTMIVSKKPPEDIEEVPPEFAPEAEGAIWIKGYWAWDDEREDYIWISGVQRVPPPGMRWVAGYWSEVDGGWQWTNGFWAPTEMEELSYREPPPESLEEGPSSPSPGDDYFYVPGTWVYETEYRWSPGYWALQRPNWCWVPARWVWTPRGCIFLRGRWDYLYAQRGCLYAPVYFHGPIYTRPGYYYRPWCALNVGNLFVHFWVRPNYCHYYFGNYYGNFDRWGLTPWHRYGGIHGGFRYDPMLSWYNCHYRRQGINYIDRISGWHRYYERHEHDRPPRTWNEQLTLASKTRITSITEINKVTNVAVKQNFLAGRVDELARMENSPVRLRKLNETQRRSMEERAQEVSREIAEVRDQRRKIERDVARVDLPGRGPDVGEKGSGRLDADKRGEAGADARVEARARLKLPESRVAVEQPRVTLPERPDRGRATDVGSRGPRGNLKTGPGDRSARTPGATEGERTERPGAKPEGRDDSEPDDAGPDRSKGNASDRIERSKAKAPGRGNDLPSAEPKGDRPRRTTPNVELPERTLPDRGPREAPGNTREGGAPGADRSNGKASRSAERPMIDTPASEPRIERPEPRAKLPEPRAERTTPKVERPAPRVERPEPRVERPAPRVERPAPRVERSLPEPRIERSAPAPRVERSAPAPRVERSAPRVERSRPEPRPDRIPSRSRGRDSD